jgi:hypothetical protein
MDAAPMVTACERGQYNLMADLPHAELVTAGAARWFSSLDPPITPSDPNVYSTYCDACACDHGAEPLIVTP